MPTAITTTTTTRDSSSGGRGHYEYFEHTADVGIRAVGATLNELFEQVALALFELITDTTNIEATTKIKIELSAKDLEQLLIDWLSTLLYTYEVDKFVFCKFDPIVDETAIKLVAFATGEKLNLTKHRIKTEVKAITYHLLRIYAEQENKLWHAQVVVDI